MLKSEQYDVHIPRHDYHDGNGQPVVNDPRIGRIVMLPVLYPGYTWTITSVMCWSDGCELFGVQCREYPAASFDAPMTVCSFVD
jgi:hypothetical protein